MKGPSMLSELDKELEKLQSRGSLSSASLNSRSKNIIIEAIIVPELELCNVKVQVFLAHVMGCADDPTLEDAPEAFNRLGMDGSDDILMLGVVNGAVGEAKAEVPIANPLIGANQTYFVGYCLVDEGLQGGLLHVLNDAGNHVTLANHQSNEYVKLRPEDIAAEFNKPIIVNEHSCWLWMGSTDKYGYARHGGLLVYGYTCRMAGKHSPVGTELRHQCPNKNCINPDHFILGTHYDNMQDARAAGTMGRHPTITIEQRTMVTKMLEEGHMQKDIAKAVGVSEMWVSEFKRGIYKHAKSVKSSEQ
jgi:hypothetical protein